MKAMILAAGRGERMRPLSDCIPKPLLRVVGKPLIQLQVEKLVAAGVLELVINVSHLREQIEAFLGDGSQWGCQISYSREPAGALETEGGILHALPLLGSRPFLVINADTWSDYPLKQLLSRSLGEDTRAHLVMVDNPAQHSGGDFVLASPLGRLKLAGPDAKFTLTYAGIALVRPSLVSDLEPGKLPLRPVLDAAIADHRITAEHYLGQWEDVGTPDRLLALDKRLRGL